jgi:hypothetical protein
VVARPHGAISTRFDAPVCVRCRRDPRAYRGGGSAGACARRNCAGSSEALRPVDHVSAVRLADAAGTRALPLCEVWVPRLVLLLISQTIL